jgi:hypothetical protein
VAGNKWSVSCPGHFGHSERADFVVSIFRVEKYITINMDASSFSGKSYTSNRLEGFTYKKTVFFTFTAVITSDFFTLVNSLSKIGVKL